MERENSGLDYRVKESPKAHRDSEIHWFSGAGPESSTTIPREKRPSEISCAGRLGISAKVSLMDERPVIFDIPTLKDIYSSEIV